MAVAFDACFGSPLALWDLSMPVRRSAGCHRMPTEPPTWRDRLCRRCRPSRIIPIPSSTFNVRKRGETHGSSGFGHNPVLFPDRLDGCRGIYLHRTIRGMGFWTH